MKIIKSASYEKISMYMTGECPGCKKHVNFSDKDGKRVCDSCGWSSGDND